MVSAEIILNCLTDRLRCLSSILSIRSDSGNRIRQPAVGDGKVPRPAKVDVRESDLLNEKSPRNFPPPDEGRRIFLLLMRDPWEAVEKPAYATLPSIFGRSQGAKRRP